MFNRMIAIMLRHPIMILCVTAGMVMGGWYAKETISIDAIPNIGQNQVIVVAEWSGRSPKDVEDQITYPLSIALLSVPGAESVRGKSLFGVSFVQVTFKDSVEFYWARTRVMEQLSSIRSQLPNGVVAKLGPDATGLGQIFYYVLKPDHEMNLADLRSLQDYVVKYALQSVDGVSEVASVGGHVRQYEVEVDPDKLRFHKVTLKQVTDAIKQAHAEIGAKTIEQAGMEFIVRGKGFLGSQEGGSQTLLDIEKAVVRTTDGVPVRVKDLGYVQNGSSFRRGALDWNGAEAVGGVVVMRYGENPRHVIDRIKKKIKELEPSLGGVSIVPVYDRSHLIDETVATLTEALNQEIMITIVVIVLFLLHIRTSLIVASVLPVAVLLSFIGMRVINLDANIMSLAGIAIAIGNMVDMGIVIAENIYQHLAELYDQCHEKQPSRDQKIAVITQAVAEIAPALMTATATTVVSFLPVFFLTGRDHKLFSPLAWTKTFALMASLIVAIGLLPVLCRLFLNPVGINPKQTNHLKSWIGALLGAAVGYGVWGSEFERLGYQILMVMGSAFVGYLLSRLMQQETLKPIENNPVSRKILEVYEPLLRWCLNYPKMTLLIPLIVFLLGLVAWRGLKTDDWIALDEGSLFYMPTLLPAVSFSQALEVLQTQDTVIKQIPEVQDVLGKIGRIDSALDPAPASMIETYVMLKPKDQWRKGITQDDVWQEITRRATLPGVTPASFLQPIEGRVVMLQSGIKASMAIRIYGDSLDGLAKGAQAVAQHLKTLSEVNAATVNPDLVLGKPYAEFEVNRDAAARYGMSVEGINNIIETAVGGKIVTYTVEGRQRYAIRVRYLRNLRDQIDHLEQLAVVTPVGEVVPLGALAKLKTTWGPSVISSEDARLVAHVAFSPSGRVGDIETTELVLNSLRQAQKAGKLSLPSGYELQAVGSFQNQIEANRRLLWLVPLVVFINLIIIYGQFRKWLLSVLVFSGIPIAMGGGMIVLWLLGVELNTAVWVGFIALFGISVDNGVILASYLEEKFSRRVLENWDEIKQGVVTASLRRVRPCLMTTATTMIALVPVLVATGRGADLARAMAWPIFGGMLVALSSLFVLPICYALMKKHRMI